MFVIGFFNRDLANDGLQSVIQDGHFTLERAMQNSTGFTVPKADLHRAYLRLLPWILVGLAIPLVLGLTSLRTSIDTAALLAVLVGSVYWYTLRYKWIFLASSGIQGLTATGAKVLIPWSEPVELGHRVAFNGIACISVKPMSKGAALLLPSSIAATSEFNAALEHLAPPNHPLRDVSGNAL